MMLRYFGWSAALLLAVPASAEPANPSPGCEVTPATAEAFELARGVVHAALPVETTDAMMRQMLASLTQQMKQSWQMDADTGDEGLTAIRERYLQKMPDRVVTVSSRHMPAIREAMACAYTHLYDINELKQINAFATSSAGRHFLSTNMQVISDPAVAKANQDYLVDAKVLMEAMAQDLATEIADYKAAKKKAAAKR